MLILHETLTSKTTEHNHPRNKFMEFDNKVKLAGNQQEMWPAHAFKGAKVGN